MTNKSTEILKLLENFNFNTLITDNSYSSDEHNENYYILGISIDDIVKIQVSIVHFNPHNKNSIDDEYLEGYIYYYINNKSIEKGPFYDFKRLKYHLSKLTIWK